MKKSLNRRNFLKTSALAVGAATLGFPAFVRARNLNSKLNIAAIGVVGKGRMDTDSCAGENIVALCDVDKRFCAEQTAKYPGAKFYRDFRKMFDEAGDTLDAVTVSTPDHTHAIIAATAMSRGKHVYCQKPLTQTIHEARHLRDMARRKKIVTQMGNQGSVEDGLRRAVEVIQSGLIGPVREIHIWSDRPILPQGMDRPEGADPVPEGLDWDLWIGPAPMRPFKTGVYNPLRWRTWQDFGTGVIGDMACHTVNMPFRALDLGHPTEVEAVALQPMNTETYPMGSRIRYEFPARHALAPVTLWWYDGGMPKPSDKPETAGDPYHNPYDFGLHDRGNRPPDELLAGVKALRGKVPASGCLLIGDRGEVFSPDDYGAEFFVRLDNEAKFTFHKKHPAVTVIPESIPRNHFEGDRDLRHHREWIAAIKENRPEMCYSNFDIAAAMTEAMLLGCVSLRVGKKLAWNGPALCATNAPEAARFIKRENRPGWELPA